MKWNGRRSGQEAKLNVEDDLRSKKKKSTTRERNVDRYLVFSERIDETVSQVEVGNGSKFSVMPWLLLCKEL